ncbi:flotillin-like protein FloA [Catalinimonas niigatensis]|uniref:flotillin-like protein FloA n=1 Tax=Catalinimonas niigatensis TaxID=1397264 RepID=UPI002666F5F5|nr:flotillin-like protein FloA [Catalinimonas niigatensis]WPP49375.1 flotillin-like protein FloA [Catalinimonas niigatensis]
MDGPFSILIIIGAVIIGIMLLFYILPINIWIPAVFSGVNVKLLNLTFMRIRRVPPSTIANAMILASKSGLSDVTSDELETHYLAGGNVPLVVKAMIIADKANIPLTFKQATAIDLAGRNVLEAVQTSVTPKIIDTPSIAGVAGDGIQLIVRARVTVRANIQQLVGGAGEDTILARVGEGIVNTIGSARSYAIILENPDHISKKILERGLDAGTAFSILSVDIADVDVGENIGAKLMIDQASADLRVAKAKAEEKRAMAVASEQEMKAKSQKARADVIAAEADVPMALAEAFRKGNLNIR